MNRLKGLASLLVILAFCCPPAMARVSTADIAVIFTGTLAEDAKRQVMEELRKQFPGVRRFNLEEANDYYMLVMVNDASEYVSYSPNLFNAFREGYLSGKRERYRAGASLMDSYGEVLFSQDNADVSRSEERAWKRAVRDFVKRFEAEVPAGNGVASRRCLLCDFQQLEDQQQVASTGLAYLGVSEQATAEGVPMGWHSLVGIAGTLFQLGDMAGLEHVLDTGEMEFEFAMVAGASFMGSGSGSPPHLINEAIRKALPDELIEKLATAYRKNGFQAVDADGLNPLGRAIMDHDLTMVQRLMDLGASPNTPMPPPRAASDGEMTYLNLFSGRLAEEAQEWSGAAPLLLAVETGQIEMVDLLLNNGVSPDWTWPDRGLDAVTYALRQGKREIAERILAAAVRAGPDPAFMANVFVSAATLGDQQMIQELLAWNVHPDAMNLAGSTSLHGVVDASARMTSLVREDRPPGAMVVSVVPGSPAAKSGIPPGLIIVAVNNEPVGSMTDLIEAVGRAGPNGSALVTTTDAGGREHVFGVYNLGTPPRLGVQVQDSVPSDAALRERAVGLDQVLGSLRAAGAGFDTPNRDGVAPVVYALELGDWEMAGKLVTLGANPNARSADGRSLLQAAVQQREVGFLETLIAHGADVASVDRRGRTALHYAYPDGSAELAEVDYAVIGTLIAAGVDPEQKDFAGLTAADSYQFERQRFFEEQEYQRRAAEARRQQEEIDRLNREAADAQRRAAREAREAEERARQAQSDAALHRALSQAANDIGTALGNAQVQQRQFEADLARQQAAIAAARAAEAEAVRRQQYAQQQSASAAAAAEERQRQLDRQQAEARRQAELERGRQRQQEIYAAVQAAEARKRAAARAENPAYSNTPRVAANASSPPSAGATSTGRSCPGWQQESYAACMCGAKTPILEDDKRHNLKDAIAAYEIACRAIWVSYTPDFDQTPPLRCQSRGQFNDDMQQRLAKDGISGYMAYASKAWDAWQANMGCTGGGG